ncbi:MAG TPA: membrane integrity-associated transporter subunit PqiC [Candidatus Pseudomonas excrementavium]|uniref:ABC-type transport auxiliary lipoprotein family protein n=1 Tax=Halopseudomonas bauzanensis TaxID=653930 RepID=UPI001C397C2E|nr:ABC-type transport auxiliary lipoprotein family protein [Halopseudomonas bauzanensis]HIZ51069.1 membrane integrity-associated transporter subunit PqiC [Candidatus Pseudomonas excrementavium]
MIRRLTSAALLTALLGLGACTILPESEALSVYQFPSPPASGASSTSTEPRLPLSLRINTPQAGYAFSGPRIMVVTADNQLQSYKGVRWSDPGPQLLREYLAVALQRSGALSSVTTDEHALHADVHLDTNLRRFQLDTDGTPRIVIELDARLVNPESRRIYVNHSFLVEHPVTSTQISDVVQGYGQATDDLTQQLLVWTRQQLAPIAQD